MILSNEIPKVIMFSNSEMSKSFNSTGLKLRDVYFRDLYSELGTNGEISYRVILRTATEYTYKMFDSWIKNNGEIDGFQKGYISYEVSCTIAKIFPELEEIEIFIKLIEYCKIDLSNKNLDTLTILSHLSII